MHKIDAPGHVANQFTDGNPGAGQPPTTVDDDWLNAVQDEIVNLLLGAGIALNKPDHTQLATYINGDLRAKINAVLADAGIAYVNGGASQLLDAINVILARTPQWAGPVQVGAQLGGFTGSAALAHMVNSDVASVVANTLGCHRFNGSTWALVGATNAVIAPDGWARLARLNSTDVAVAHVGSSGALKCARFNGAAWTQVGNNFALGVNTPNRNDICQLTANTIAYIDNLNHLLRVLSFDGTNWSQVGNSLDLGAIGDPALSGINATDFAFIDSTNESMRMYRFDGTNIAQVGASFAIPGIGRPALTAMNASDIAMIDGDTDILRLIRWSGAAFSLVGGTITLAGDTPALAAINGIDVAFFASIDAVLKLFRFGYAVSGPYRP